MNQTVVGRDIKREDGGPKKKIQKKEKSKRYLPRHNS
jgi:hypothetical protein